MLNSFSNNNCDITLIFGTGSCENSWKPVHRALSCYYRENMDNNDSANVLLSVYICLLRQCLPSMNPEDFKCKYYEPICSIKSAIAKEINISVENNEVFPRKSFMSAIDKIKKYARINNTITTNWDRAADKLFENPVIHIHGTSDLNDDLYLPTETSIENYRPDQANEKFHAMHMNAEKVISESDIIIVFGVSFMPLDAELYTIFFGNQEREKIVLILDPEYQRVAGRLQFAFMHRDKLRFYTADPDNDLEVDTALIHIFEKPL